MLTPTSQPNKTPYCPYKKKLKTFNETLSKTPPFPRRSYQFQLSRDHPVKLKSLK
jgi:hypothetical protein